MEEQGCFQWKWVSQRPWGQQRACPLPLPDCPELMDSEDKGTNYGSDITNVEKSFPCHAVRIALKLSFAVWEITNKSLFSLQGRKKQLCAACEGNLCTLIEIQGIKGCVWRHGFAAASLSFDFSLPQAKEDLVSRNSHVETSAGCSLCCPICTSPFLLLPIIFTIWFVHLYGFQDWVKCENWPLYQVRPGPSFLFEQPMCEHCCLFCLLPLITWSFLYCLGRVVGRGGFGARWKTFPGAICAFCLPFQLPVETHHSF